MVLSRRTIQRLLGRRFPRIWLEWMRFAHKRAWSDQAAFAQRYGMRVSRGPFEGMIFPQEAVHGSFHLVPKLLGSYESELHPFLERILREDFGCVVNIGSGDGYYAVGLARRLPTATIYAFDIEATRRWLCERTADVNGVAERVLVQGACDAARLTQVLRDHTLIVCDCEGCELDVLMTEESPGLADSTLVIELHDALRPGVTRRMYERFASSHAIELVESKPRNPRAYSELAMLDAGRRAALLSEERGSMSWAILHPRHR